MKIKEKVISWWNGFTREDKIEMGIAAAALAVAGGFAIIESRKAKAIKPKVDQAKAEILEVLNKSKENYKRAWKEADDAMLDRDYKRRKFLRINNK